ncbi:hypothetical protein F5148DRAFT_393560 [Russula earlei]|uniref:Uncharacterized protein n=1 Tax=Russula earlei TaxID=71964 RepID=A0ACC0U0I5_9AGAM|nr:hypothetical protein F5148DRAFT_393560 [Russula earlei]
MYADGQTSDGVSRRRRPKTVQGRNHINPHLFLARPIGACCLPFRTLHVDEHAEVREFRASFLQSRSSGGNRTKLEAWRGWSRHVHRARVHDRVRRPVTPTLNPAVYLHLWMTLTRIVTMPRKSCREPSAGFALRHACRTYVFCGVRGSRMEPRNASVTVLWLWVTISLRTTNALVFVLLSRLNHGLIWVMLLLCAAAATTTGRSRLALPCWEGGECPPSFLARSSAFVSLSNAA